MIQPTAQQARALADLPTDSGVREYVQACLDDTKHRLVTVADSEAFRIIQGHAQAYQNLLDCIEGPTKSGKR
jgi:hypothetical protein